VLDIANIGRETLWHFVLIKLSLSLARVLSLASSNIVEDFAFFFHVSHHKYINI